MNSAMNSFSGSQRNDHSSSRSFVDSSSRFHLFMEHFQTIDSTQTYLMNERLGELSNARASSHTRIHVASSDFQSRGKGTGSREWFSSQDYSSVAMSIQIPVPAKLVRHAPFLTQLLALAVCRAFETLLGDRSVGIKWPNDIVLKGHKIGGILAELIPVTSDLYAVIIGVGLNLDIPDTVLRTGVGSRALWPPGAVKQLTDNSVDRAVVRETVFNSFLPLVRNFLDSQGIASLAKTVSERHVFVGNTVLFREGEGEKTVEGVFLGLNETGGLIIRTGGVDRVFYSGELLAA